MGLVEIHKRMVKNCIFPPKFIIKEGTKASFGNWKRMPFGSWATGGPIAYYGACVAFSTGAIYAAATAAAAAASNCNIKAAVLS